MGIKKLFNTGKNIIGEAGGAAIGYSVGGCEGAMIGAASGELITIVIDKIGADFAERIVSPREDYRLGLVYLNARKKILEKLAAGEQLRKDLETTSAITSPACIEIPIKERPPCVEAIEGILLAAQREHEEKKLPFISNLLANICCDSNIDIFQIDFLIKISSTMSFRQMCILCMFSDPYISKIKGRYCAEATFPKFNENLDSIFQEIIDLGSKGLLYANNEPVTKAALIDNPREIKVIGAGISLYKLMELKKIDEKYLDAITYDLFPQESERYPPQKRNPR